MAVLALEPPLNMALAAAEVPLPLELMVLALRVATAALALPRLFPAPQRHMLAVVEVLLLLALSLLAELVVEEMVA